MNELILWVLTLGLPLLVTNYLMENSPFLQVSSKWIQSLTKYVPAKLVRRGVSLIIPFVVSGGVVGLAVLTGALLEPPNLDAWFFLIYDYSGVAVLLPQIVDAAKSKATQ